jgi:hypothetical protein
MGRRIDALLAEHASREFLLDGLAGGGAEAAEPRRTEMFRFLAAGAHRLDNRLKKVALQRIVDLVPALRGEPRRAGCAAAAQLFRHLPLRPGEPAFDAFLRLLEERRAEITFYLGAALLEKRPDLAVEVLGTPARLFALVTVDESRRQLLRGRVTLRRLPSGSRFSRPLLILEHVEANERVVARRQLPVRLPGRLLAASKSGGAQSSFRLALDARPLSRGLWRASLELTREGATGSGSWRSPGTPFRVAGN